MQDTYAHRQYNLHGQCFVTAPRPYTMHGVYVPDHDKKRDPRSDGRPHYVVEQVSQLS